MKTGFIYLWKDTEKNKYYLGSHLGKPEDNYIGSGVLFINAYNKRPQAFVRKVIEKNIPKSSLLAREEAWLSLIPVDELGKKYYNLKKVAAGGDIISNLSEEARKQHAEKTGIASKKMWEHMSEEELLRRKETAFGGNKFDRSYMIERNKKLCAKTAKVVDRDGNTFEIKNVCEFCRNNKLNYGNFKTMLRGKAKQCQGYRGSYV